MPHSNVVRGLVSSLCAAALLSCMGGRTDLGDPPGAGDQSADPDTPAGAKIVLSFKGVQPGTLAVAPGAEVTIVNDDFHQHRIAPRESEANQCPELASPVLQPGTSFVTTMGKEPKTCHYLDALAPADDAYQGRVVVGGGAKGPADTGAGGDAGPASDAGGGKPDAGTTTGGGGATH